MHLGAATESNTEDVSSFPGNISFVGTGRTVQGNAGTSVSSPVAGSDTANGGKGAEIPGTYGTVYLKELETIGSGRTADFSYELNNRHASLDTLDRVETLTEQFTFSLNGGSPRSTITVTINGADEPAGPPAPPANTAPMVDAITEAITYADTAATNTAASFTEHTGTFTVTDPNGGDTQTFTVVLGNTAAVADTSMTGFTHRVEGMYSTLFYADTDASGITGGDWMVVAKASVIDALDETQTGLTDTYTVTANDGTANSANSRDLVITVNGANDLPTATPSTITKTNLPHAPYEFTIADFRFTDADTGDQLEQVLIFGIGNHGTLTVTRDATGMQETVGNGTRLLSRTEIASLEYVTLTPGNYRDDTVEYRVNDGVADSTGIYQIALDFA